MSAGPHLSFDPALLLQAQPVEVVFLDMDGILASPAPCPTAPGAGGGGLHAPDAYGLRLLAHAGITPVVITNLNAPGLLADLGARGLPHVQGGTQDKRACAEQWLSRLGLGWHQAAAVGHDWPDLPLLVRCAWVAAPPGAHAEVRARAHYITRSAAGVGAMREVCDLLLCAKGCYASLLDKALAGDALGHGDGA